MKILYFSFVELDTPNACQTHTLGILKGFGENGCKVDAFIPKPISIKPKILNIRFHYIWPWQFSFLGTIYAKYFSGILFFILCFFNKYDAIYVRELATNPFPRWCSRVFRVPLYIEINGILIKQLNQTGASWNTIQRTERNQRKDLLVAKGLIVPSYPRKKWLENYYGLNPKKVHLILNGVDRVNAKKLNRKNALESLRLPENGFYLCYLGTIWEYYDLRCIIEAMVICNETIPNLNLIVIGDGPKALEMKELAFRKGVSTKVHFLGYFQPDTLHKIIGAADVGLMVMTRKGVEFGGPITSRFASYVSFNLPVIATKLYIEEYPEELRAGLTLVEPENCDELSKAINHIYKDPEDTSKKVEILKNFVINRLTWKKVAFEILSKMKTEEVR